MRKGSLNLSIEAIVIVVIAFVVLGLGLGFVRSQFKSIEETTSSVQEQIRQQILDDLRTGNKKLSFPANELRLETGESSVQAIGVKNTDDDDRTLRIIFKIRDAGQFEEFVSGETKSLSAGAFEASVFWDDSAVTYQPDETRVVPVTIEAPDKTGNYLYKIEIVKIVDGMEEPFDERTFFIRTI